MNTELAQWLTLLAVTLGLIVTWVQNGRHQATRDQSVVDSVGEVKKSIEDDKTGLPAVNEKLQKLDKTYAVLNAKTDGRVSVLERDMKDVKQKVNNKPRAS